MTDDTALITGSRLRKMPPIAQSNATSWRKRHWREQQSAADGLVDAVRAR
jgi:hypothetical protein